MSVIGIAVRVYGDAGQLTHEQVFFKRDYSDAEESAKEHVKSLQRRGVGLVHMVPLVDEEIATP